MRIIVLFILLFLFAGCSTPKVIVIKEPLDDMLSNLPNNLPIPVSSISKSDEIEKAITRIKKIVYLSDEEIMFSCFTLEQRAFILAFMHVGFNMIEVAKFVTPDIKLSVKDFLFLHRDVLYRNGNIDEIIREDAVMALYWWGNYETNLIYQIEKNFDFYKMYLKRKEKCYEEQGILRETEK